MLHTNKLTILGAGAWGSALALYLARKHYSICLWSNSTDHVASLVRDRVNAKYLPGHVLPDNIIVTDDLVGSLRFARDIVIAVPSVGYRDLLQQIKLFLPEQSRFLSATKGMDSTQQLLHQTFAEIIGDNHAFGVIAGPSFAQEVANSLPAALVIASGDLSFRHDMQAVFKSQLLHIELSTDLTGIAIAGIIKNVLAIAVGILDGMQLGANARSALMTKGFNELLILSQAMGAQINTCFGLAGIGDLILTCTNDLSRNRRFGLALGAGQNFTAVMRDIGQVIEGISNVTLINQLAANYLVQLPICNTVAAIVAQNISPTGAMLNLFNNMG